MGTQSRPADGAMTLAEMKEFAAFPAATQRYIRRSLDVGLAREDALGRWSRDVIEASSIRAQTRIYGRLDDIRGIVPDDSRLRFDPGDQDDKLDVALDESFPTSDAPSNTQPGKGKDPAPSSGYDEAAERERLKQGE